MANAVQAYYFTQNGRECGPISVSQIKKLASSGRLRASDMVRRSGTNRWFTAASVQGLLRPQASMPITPPQVEETYDIEDEILEA
jgi:GYF domain 2